jgi:hypothetical protein
MPIHYEASSPSIAGRANRQGCSTSSHMGQLTIAGSGLDAALEGLLPATCRC